VLHLIEETARTGQMQRCGTVQTEAQQAIEAGKMIHVGVGNKNMTDAHELARGQRRHVAKIEEQGPATESEVDEQRGIREGSIDEPRLHEPGHSIPLQLDARPVVVKGSTVPKLGTFVCVNSLSERCQEEVRRFHGRR
jgi:hypothetical protein